MLAILGVLLLPGGRAFAQAAETSPTLANPAPKVVERKEIELPPAPEAEGEELVRVTTPSGNLSYDQEKGFIYGNQRSFITYGQIKLEADKVIFDVRLKELQAQGNVVLTGPENEIHADKMRYNFRENEGEAYQATGRFGNFYFRYNKKEGNKPSFQRLSADESVLTGSSITGCDFVIPHYRITAREIVVYQNDRIFMRGATLYVREIPVFYFPAFSKSLTEESPWFIRLGYSSKLGAWLRVGYNYNHSTQEPSLEDPKKLVTKSEGKASFFVDYLQKEGPGAGLNYDYMFNYNRHKGHTELYALQDSNFKSGAEHLDYKNKTIDSSGNVVDANGVQHKNFKEEDALTRYQIFLNHRSEITQNLIWLVNLDEFSDPDLYEQILDTFRDEDRRRVVDRDARTALTFTREQYSARVLFEIKDRIGRDRINNFSVPKDNDKDFDDQPDLDIKDRNANGLSSERWGTVTTRAPQITLSTAWLRLLGTPLYFHSDLNIFNNLDKGLNTVSTDDDAYVQGIDWYNALMFRWRLAERYTLLTKIGAGVGTAVRDDDSFNYFTNSEFNEQVTDDNHDLILNDIEGGLTFTDPDTFLIGTKPFNLNQVKDAYAYGDLMTRLNARFSNDLKGDLIYRYRATSDDFLGDWYAQMGDRWVRDDLYNFRLRENNLEGLLRYAVVNPRLSVTLRGLNNFVSEGELFPYELKSTYGIYGDWSNRENTVKVNASVSYDRRQIFHPSDPSSFISPSFGYNTSVSYKPISELWWTRLGIGYQEQLSGHDTSESNDDARFVEDKNYYTVSPLIGGRVGPKWISELGASYDSRISNFKQLRVTFKRDLHDALLLMMLGVKNDPYADTTSNSTTKQNLEFQLAVQPKLPYGKQPEGVPGIRTINDRVKAPEVEVGGTSQVYAR